MKDIEYLLEAKARHKAQDRRIKEMVEQQRKNLEKAVEAHLKDQDTKMIDAIVQLIQSGDVSFAVLSSANLNYNETSVPKLMYEPFKLRQELEFKTITLEAKCEVLKSQRDLALYYLNHDDIALEFEKRFKSEIEDIERMGIIK